MSIINNEVTVHLIMNFDENFEWETIINNFQENHTQIFDFSNVHFLNFKFLQELKKTINLIENRFITNVSPCLLKVLKLADINVTRIRGENPV